MKKEFWAVLLFGLMLWGFYDRSFQSMATIANSEFRDHMQDIGVDTSGFRGPEIFLGKNKLVVFRWKKAIEDTINVDVEVSVDSRRFREPMITDGGPGDTWKKLAQQKNIR